MGPIDYTVKQIDGDCAHPVSGEGLENTVARTSSPMEVDEGVSSGKTRK